jgi:hypothetical protein
MDYIKVLEEQIEVLQKVQTGIDDREYSAKCEVACVIAKLTDQIFDMLTYCDGCDCGDEETGKEVEN